MVGGFARDIEIKVYLKDFMYHQLETLAIILITLLTLVLIIINTYSVSVLVNWQHNYLGTIMVPSLFFFASITIVANTQSSLMTVVL